MFPLIYTFSAEYVELNELLRFQSPPFRLTKVTGNRDIINHATSKLC